MMPTSLEALLELSFEGLVQVPVTLTTEGDPQAVMELIQYLATTNDRFFTMTNFTIDKADVTEVIAGRPALTEKDWVTSLTFMVFILVDPQYTLVPEEPGTNPDYDGGAIDNPFTPLPGTEEKGAGNS